VALFRDLGRATQRLLDGYSEAELQLLTAFLGGACDALSHQATVVSQHATHAHRLRV
jgi:hypothetical protein